MSVYEILHGFQRTDLLKFEIVLYDDTLIIMSIECSQMIMNLVKMMNRKEVMCLTFSEEIMKLLTPEQKQFYDDNGYIVLDILTEEEISELSKEFDKVFQAKAHCDLEATWEGDWKKDNKKNVSMYFALFEN